MDLKFYISKHNLYFHLAMHSFLLPINGIQSALGSHFGFKLASYLYDLY